MMNVKLFIFAKNEEEDFKYLIHPHHLNKINIYSYYLNKAKYINSSPISAFQPLMLVFCKEEGNNTEDYYC